LKKAECDEKMKSEARNPNFETNSKSQISKPQKRCLKGFDHSNFEFVSDFDIRISSFMTN